MNWTFLFFALFTRAFCSCSVLENTTTTNTTTTSTTNEHPHPFHFVFLHYHKSGHDLARRLAEVFLTPPCTASVKWASKRRCPLQVIQHEVLETDVVVVAAAQMHFSWREGLKELPNVRYVHFVRDPLDLIVSGYLYHEQDPPPIQVYR
jgi:hypothetical protein